MASETIPSSRDASEDDEEEEAAGGRGWADMCWRLGKKVAIVGTALASAPIVIPSYCVASTLGLALAVPFGVYLATVAATDKVMSSLLPPPPPDVLEEDFEEGLECSSINTKEEEEEEKPVREREVMAPKSEESPTTDPSLEAETEMNPSSEYALAMVVEEEKHVPDARGYGYVETGMVVKSAYEIFGSKDKIWEEISALRTIMGYKAALHSSTVEELRALYLFTGVEPPISLKEDPSNMMEIEDKLQFLKLLVGVK